MQMATAQCDHEELSTRWVRVGEGPGLDNGVALEP